MKKIMLCTLSILLWNNKPEDNINQKKTEAAISAEDATLLKEQKADAEFQKKQEELMKLNISQLEKSRVNLMKEYQANKDKLQKTIQSHTKDGAIFPILKKTLVEDEFVPSNLLQEIEKEIEQEKENVLFNKNEIDLANKKLDYFRKNASEIIALKMQIKDLSRLLKSVEKKTETYLTQLKKIIKTNSIDVDQVLSNQAFKNEDVLQFISTIDDMKDSTLDSAAATGVLLKLIQLNKAKLNLQRK